MELGSAKKSAYCPLCGNDIAKSGNEENTETILVTFFECACEAHSVPYIMADCVSVEDRARLLIVSSSTSGTMMPEERFYCFLCGSALVVSITYSDIEQDGLKGETKVFCFYECMKEGHVWQVVNDIKQVKFMFMSFQNFDVLLRLFGVVSHHHIVIPVHRTKRHLLRLLLRDSFSA